jgi:arginyl-tRNA synthetase
MLGNALGQKAGALDQYHQWCKLAGYHPTVYLDTDLPAPTVPLVDGRGEYAGCKLFKGVVVFKSDGKPTYAAHDLAFAALVGPTHYLTGAEQQGHFAGLGLGGNHLPLGLVLGADGKKMKSTVKQAGEEANLTTAQELLDSVVAALSETPEPVKLAWNILAWQFNSSAVSGMTKFNLQQWAKAESPGLYVSYTYAKLMSAIGKATEHPEPVGLTVADANLLGIAGQYAYHFAKAQQAMQPCHVAQYALTLAKKLASYYGVHSIKDASPSTLYAVTTATGALGQCMANLSMHLLTAI